MASPGVNQETAEALSQKFAALLRTEKDPSVNFNIDVAALLEDYLRTLSSSADGASSSAAVDPGKAALAINFAQAALLIQGSAAVYGRKTDFLYNLALQALALFSQRQIQQEQEGEGNNQEGDNQAQDEEETFLNLDDLPVMDEPEEEVEDPAPGQRRQAGADGGRPQSQWSRPPSILLGLEEEPILQAQGFGKDGMSSAQEEAQRALRYQTNFMVASSRMSADGAVLLPTVPDDRADMRNAQDTTGDNRFSAYAGMGSKDQSVSDCEQLRKASSEHGMPGSDSGAAPSIIHSDDRPFSGDKVPGSDGHTGLHDVPGAGDIPMDRDNDDDDWGGGGVDDDPGSFSLGPEASGRVGEGDGLHAADSVRGAPRSERDGRKVEEEIKDEPVYDPFEPLDPEDVTGGREGSLAQALNKPYARGRPMLRMPAPGSLDWRGNALMDPLMSAFNPWMPPPNAQRRGVPHAQVPYTLPLASLQTAVDHILGMHSEEDWAEGEEWEDQRADGNWDPNGSKHQRRSEFEGAPSPRNAPDLAHAHADADVGGMDGDDNWSTDGGGGLDDDDLGRPDEDLGGGSNDAAPGVSSFEGVLGAGLDNPAGLFSGNNDELDPEKLRQKTIEEMMRAAAQEDAGQQSALERRVAQWQNTILPLLQVQEDRGPFDIHNYAEKILVKLEHEHKEAHKGKQSPAADAGFGEAGGRAGAGESGVVDGGGASKSQGSGLLPETQQTGMEGEREGRLDDTGRTGKSVSTDPVPFQDIAAEQQSYQVARYFSAMLHLVNQGNVEIIRQDIGGAKAAGGCTQGESGVTLAADVILGSQASVTGARKHGKGPAREPSSAKSQNGEKEPVCYTKDNPFNVRLLSTHRHHEELLEYRLPGLEDQSNAYGRQVQAARKGKGPAEAKADLARRPPRPAASKRQNTGVGGASQVTETAVTGSPAGGAPRTGAGRKTSAGVRNGAMGRSRISGDGEGEETLPDLDCTPPIICTGKSATGQG